ncbi:hypothetical protein HK101_000446, partial [Irineochytrium annulatum]
MPVVPEDVSVDGSVMLTQAQLEQALQVRGVKAQVLFMRLHSGSHAKSSIGHTTHDGADAVKNTASVGTAGVAVKSPGVDVAVSTS